MGELVTKKEVLEKYGISYGALYRWKRKGLIPEEWFIRKSTYTGQETYFDSELIYPRIDEIVRLKDSASLDELAEQFNPNNKSRRMLVIEAAGAKVRIAADDISRVYIEDGDSEQDITDAVKEILL